MSDFHGNYCFFPEDERLDDDRALLLLPPEDERLEDARVLLLLPPEDRDDDPR